MKSNIKIEINEAYIYYFEMLTKSKLFSNSSSSRSRRCRAWQRRRCTCTISIRRLVLKKLFRNFGLQSDCRNGQTTTLTIASNERPFKET